MNNNNEKLRKLPQIDKLASAPEFTGLNSVLLKKAARNVLENIRCDIIDKDTEVPDLQIIIQEVKSEYHKLTRGTLHKVINATGVPIHTNLGRSPIDKSVLEEAIEISSGYSNLEYDVANGKRGDRYHHTAKYLCELTGAEDAIVVNNNASAVFIILNTLARNKEVAVSRGELVEIGGSFRVPDVMSRSGAKLVEVGSTNKTRISDYAGSVSSKTAMFMKVHKSNYEIVGFSEETSLDEIAREAKHQGVISYYDAGSGLFRKIIPESVCGDQTIPEVISKGIDIVSFSGDKMLGGCQAGIIAGKKDLIKKIKKNPLMRMLRVDKLTLAVLQGTFRKYLERNDNELPVNRMLTEPPESLFKRAEKLVSMLSCKTTIIKIKSTVGGGSCPLAEQDSYGIIVHSGKRSSAVDKCLRNAATPVVARIIDDKVVLDIRTIDEQEYTIVCEAVEGAV